MQISRKDKIWQNLGYQNDGVLFKQGCQNSKFNHLRWTDEIFRIDKMKLILTKFEGTEMKGSYSNKDAKIQNWATHPGLIKFFRIGKYEKIKFGSTTVGVPSNDNAKIHTFYFCKLDTSQFQDTQANMKER